MTPNAERPPLGIRYLTGAVLSRPGYSLKFEHVFYLRGIMKPGTKAPNHDDVRTVRDLIRYASGRNLRACEVTSEFGPLRDS